MDTNVSQLDMVLASCGAGEKGCKQAITYVRGAGWKRALPWVHPAQSLSLS